MLINNMCFPSTVSPAYAPDGRHLASVSLVGNFEDYTDEELERAVREELGRDWFPDSTGAGAVSSWRHLRTYRIPYAQPPATVPTDLRRPVALVDGAVYTCGDHRESASLEGAIVSGVRAASAVLESMGR